MNGSKMFPTSFDAAGVRFDAPRDEGSLDEYGKRCFQEIVSENTEANRPYAKLIRDESGEAQLAVLAGWGEAANDSLSVFSPIIIITKTGKVLEVDSNNNDLSTTGLGRETFANLVREGYSNIRAEYLGGDDPTSVTLRSTLSRRAFGPLSLSRDQESETSPVQVISNTEHIKDRIAQAKAFVSGGSSKEESGKITSHPEKIILEHEEKILPQLRPFFKAKIRNEISDTLQTFPYALVLGANENQRPMFIFASIPAEDGIYLYDVESGSVFNIESKYLLNQNGGLSDLVKMIFKEPTVGRLHQPDEKGIEKVEIGGIVKMITFTPVVDKNRPLAPQEVTLSMSRVEYLPKLVQIQQKAFELAHIPLPKETPEQVAIREATERATLLSNLM